MVNAAVFPEPVTAPPTTSLPKSATGIVAACIGVGLMKPTVVRAFKIGRERFIVRNEEWTSVEAAFESKKAALRSISACVSGWVSSDENETASEKASS